MYAAHSLAGSGGITVVPLQVWVPINSWPRQIDSGHMLVLHRAPQQDSCSWRAALEEPCNRRAELWPPH